MGERGSRGLDAGYRFALNPIQWMATEDGWLDPGKGPQGEELLREVKRAGFSAIHAQVPAEWSTAAYRAALAAAGLESAPGYASLPVPESESSLAQALEALRPAAAQQAELGATTMFLACRMAKGAPRVLSPAVGALHDKTRLTQVTDLIGRAAEVMRAAGVSALLHPHVGTWIETEDETRQVLDSIDSSVLGFGPDTGHLSWARADTIRLLSDYQPRIGAVHVKDLRLNVRDRALVAGLSYQETVVQGLWAEPGLGDLNLEGMVAALGAGFDGWLVAEVDYPTMPPFESAQASARWLSALRHPTP